MLHSGIRVTGNEERLQVLYSADRVRYADLYELYNVRNELGVHNNHVDNKISWCNWGRHTYSGELKTGLTFYPCREEWLSFGNRDGAGGDCPGR